MFGESKRVRIGFNLSREAKDLIERLAKRLGISQTSVVEQAVRDLARREGILAEREG